LASLYITKKKLLLFNPGFGVISIIINRNMVKKLFNERNYMSEVIVPKILNDGVNIKIEHIEDAF